MPNIIDHLRDSWNAQADEFNDWDSLGLDEMLEWAQVQATQTKKDLPIDDLDEFAVYWWGPDVDGENSLADAIESGQMSEFARAVLGHSPLTPAEIQLLKEGKCLQMGDYNIQLDGDFTTDAILRIAATLKGERPSV